MRKGIRLVVAGLVVLHGLVHLLGAVQAFGWADIGQLTTPMSTGMGVVWLIVAVLLVLTGGLLVFDVPRWWWILGALAAVVSQVTIMSSWGDAKAGTAVNVVLLAAVGFLVASHGPWSYRVHYRRAADVALAGSVTGNELVTEGDLALLPSLIAAYLRQAGTIGQPRVGDFCARFHGRIRDSATAAWMAFTGDQVNTFGPVPARLFFMDATKFGLPIDILHTFIGPAATMRVRACSLVTVASASGEVMDRAETVTLFNDLCVLAPAALIDAPVRWHPIDDRHIQGEFTHGAHTISATLTFNDGYELIDFVSDDRFRASADGKTFVPQRWSTPICEYRTLDSRRVGTRGEGRWHATDPEGEFAYLEFHLDEITYNNGTTHAKDQVRNPFMRESPHSQSGADSVTLPARDNPAGT